MVLNPLGKTFLFQFCNDTTEGVFKAKNKGRIIIAGTTVDRQGDYARWAKVMAIGPEVVDFKVGDIVLIGALRWTKGLTHKDVMIWKSDESEVLALANDESVAYDYGYEYGSLA